MMRPMHRSGTAEVLNRIVDGLVAAGRYRAALELPGQFRASDRDSCSELLVQINLAEAEYNLGRWDAADERIRDLAPLTAMFPITRAGLAQQRAWIAAHQGRADDALRFLRQARLEDLPPPYHAEHHFTAAAAHLAARDLPAAHRFAVLGQRSAVRPSSVRNALFIRARVAAAEGDLAAADRFCRDAAAHRWRSQGGDGLVLWGDVLRRLGREDEATRAYELAVQRDPESESAATAASSLCRH